MSFALLDAIWSILLSLIGHNSGENRVPIVPAPKIENITPVARSWCSTEIKLAKFSHTWTIDNFSFCRHAVGENILSPIFTVSEGNDRIELRLEVFPSGHRAGADNCLSVFLQLVECKEPEVSAKFKFSIVDAKGKKIHGGENNDKLDLSIVKLARRYERGYLKFINRSMLLARASELMPDDKLTLCCEGTISVATVSVSGKNKPIDLGLSAGCGIADDLGKLLETGTLSDVSLWVGGREFRAHKAILAAGSPVFSAMFDHGMEERQRNNRVDINDIEQGVFEKLLSFIYTGKATNLETMAEALLAASDKYALERLKVMCEMSMFTSLSMMNAVRILVLADLHNANQLKKRAMQIINTHAKDITSTEDFKSIIHSHPHLIAEAYAMLSMKIGSDGDR